MAFKWDRIRSYADTETALYRLLGEMMQRKATLDDLDLIREFLLGQGPGAESWQSIGEALYRTTSGSPTGYDIWVEWTRSLPNYDFDEELQGSTWVQFDEELSEAAEVEDPMVDIVPPALGQASSTQADENDDDAEAHTDVMESTAWSRPAQTGVLAGSPTQLLRMVPTGPYSIRIFGETFDDIDEYTVLTLMKRGLFLGCQIRFGGEWVPAIDHPAFFTIVGRLRDEAFRILARPNPLATDEVTSPRH